MTGTVLIIDEDVNAQIIAETLLRLRGFAVRVVADAYAAAAIIAREDVGVIVVDLGVRTNAVDVLRRLRTAAAQLPVPPRIIALTDRKEPELERFTRRLGADAVLRKPTDPGRFIAAVEGSMAATYERALAASTSG